MKVLLIEQIDDFSIREENKANRRQCIFTEAERSNFLLLPLFDALPILQGHL